MRIADTFQCKIVDEYGGVYPDAIATILDGHEFLNRGFSADAPGSQYVFKTETDGAAYRVMYWYNKESVGKYKSRPLLVAEGNGFTDVIKADMAHAEAKEIVAKPMSQDEKTLQLVKYDLMRMWD